MISVEEHGKQIRTIHFALLTLTFGLIVVWMDRSPTDLALASKQAEEIESLLRSWDPLFLDSYARDQLTKNGKPEGFRPTTQIEVKVPNTQETKAFAFSDRCWTLHPLPAPLRQWDASFQKRQVRHRGYIQIENPFLRGETFVSPPSKLSQFFELWDGLNQQVQVNKPVDVSDICYVHLVFGGAKEWNTVKETTLPNGEPLPNHRMVFRALTDYESKFFPNEELFAAEPYSWWIFVNRK